MLTASPVLRFKDILRRKAYDLNGLCESGSLYLTFSGRGALFQLFRAFSQDKKKVILLPAFHCVALVEPVIRAGFTPKFYRIRTDFSIDLKDLKGKLAADVAAIIVINFFGFPCEIDEVSKLRDPFNCFIVEDCAHSFLRADPKRIVGGCGDFAVYGFSKLFASIGGGGLRVNLSNFEFRPSRKRVGLVETLIVAKRLFENILTHSKDGVSKRAYEFLEAKRVQCKRANFKESASRFVYDPYLFQENLALAKLPWLCRRIIECEDLDKNVALRRRNYVLLNCELRETDSLRKPFAVLPENVCPWVYPLLLKDRAQHDFRLRDFGVPLLTFGEVLHPILEQADALTQKDALWLSRQLLLLPVHQSLEPEDMTAMADSVNRYSKNLI